MRGAAVCVLLCFGAVVSNIGATESRKYEGGLAVEEKAGKRLIASQGGKNNYEETIEEKTNEDGSRSTIYKKETRRKLEGKTSLTLVTEEVLKNEIYPKGFKVIKSVVSGTVDDKDPKNNDLSFFKSEIYPDFESWTPMFPDRRPVEKTYYRQGSVPQPTGVLETPPPQYEPESGRKPQDPSLANERPPIAAHNGERVPAQTVDGRTGANPSQYGPGSGYNPQDPSIVNERPPFAAHNGERVSAPTVDGRSGPNPSQYGPGSGRNPQDPSIANERPPIAAHNGERVSGQTVDGRSGPNPSQYGPGSGHNLQNPSIVNQLSNSAAYNEKKKSAPLLGRKTGAYRKQ